MKFYNLTKMIKYAAHAMILLIGMIILANSGLAQTIGSTVKGEILLAESADLDQCRNGTPAPGFPCDNVSGGNWVNGNAGEQNSSWKERDYLPYRMLFNDLPTGSTVHTVIIGYDVKHSGAHAIDYLGTYNSTNAANPCAGVSGCNLGTFTTFSIAQDTVAVTSQINPNTGMPIVQPNDQVMTLFGGTLLSFAYTAIDGDMTDSQVERQVTITFTADVANPVLAWSGHVGWNGDWGAGNSAGGISGSPYHMRLIDLNGSGGNQDRSLAAAAVAPGPGFITIVKEVITQGGGTSSPTAFSFTASSNFGTTSFFLTDDDGGPGIDNQASQPITAFGPANSITVQENLGATPNWAISNLQCVEIGGVNDSTPQPPGQILATATIIVQPGELITCTFRNTNLVPTAAPADISGRVSDSNGYGLAFARVSVQNASTGEIRTALTNNFGYYTVRDLPSGEFYQVSVSHKRYTFQSQFVSLLDDIAGMDFTALPE